MQRVVALLPSGETVTSNKFNPLLMPDLVQFFRRKYPKAKLKVEETPGSRRGRKPRSL